MQLVQGGYQIQIEAVATFWSSYEYLIHYQREDFGARQMVI